jgi:hypothetical protein
MKSATRCRAVALVAVLSTLAACANPDPPTAVIRRDTELVGMWKGPMGGTYGSSVLTLVLRADSTMAADNENANYSHIDGVWTMSDRRFSATASPGYGVVVTLVAFAPFVHLIGTWTSNGASGSFDLSKR